jgi:tetratricopeptide (TPR) repeat protein
MKDTDATQKAHILLNGAARLFQQGRFDQALIELELAEALYRQADIPGSPRIIALENGISGLANTLALSGRCHQQQGDLNAAVRCYELSFLNANFEKTIPFRRFAAEVNADLVICYTGAREVMPQERIGLFLNGDPLISTGARFPFSLEPDAAVLARLFELAPKQHADYRHAYLRAKRRDSEARTREKRSDTAMMERFSVSIWAILIVIWALYGLFVVNTLLNEK